tara:strand:+ start:11618 stop:12412 length:795 start_codon:yes stop_codon:yes gene_type:complete
MVLAQSEVSVLMTVYNGQSYIGDAIKSLINQSFKKWKLIIVDDASTDNSLNEIKKFKDSRVKIYKLKKRVGRMKAFNYGLRYCKSDFIAVLDADDISHKRRFEKQINFFKKNSNASVIGTWFNHIDSKGKIFAKMKPTTKVNEIRKKLIISNIIAHSTIMFRRSILKKIKGYSKLKYAIDYGFILKVLKKRLNIMVIPEFLCSCRFHNKRISANPKFQKMILNEKLYLLNWSKNNFKFDLLDEYNYMFEKVKTLIKLFKINFAN